VSEFAFTSLKVCIAEAAVNTMLRAVFERPGGGKLVEIA
jgi:hypothetical protein